MTNWKCTPFNHVKWLTGNTRNSAIIWALVQIASVFSYFQIM